MSFFGSKKFALLLGFAFFLAAGLVFAPKTLAATKPFFAAKGGDVFAGGWFDSDTSCVNGPAGSYQSPTVSGSNYSGAILSFVYTPTRVGANTNMAAFATGTIEASSTSQYGFFTGLPSAGFYSLGFATPTDPNTAWGGLFEGSVQQAHCIPDYFDTKINQGSTYKWDSTITNTFPVQYYIKTIDTTTCPTACSGGIVNLNALNYGDPPNNQTIPAGTHLTIFVDGDAYIGNNICYVSCALGSTYTADQIPKFALVVQGDIFIDPRVQRLDGLYIAQPDPGDLDPVNNDTGIIWTCHDKTLVAPTLDWVYQHPCDNLLTVNGAFIAKNVELERTRGDGRLDPSHTAETINYTPAMVIGGPFFNPLPDPSLKIDSIISLPPVF